MEERTLSEDEMELYGLKLKTDSLEDEEEWQEEEKDDGRRVVTPAVPPRKG